MTCDCDDEADDVDDAPGDADDLQAELEVVVGDSDGFLSVSVSGSNGESTAEMVETVEDVLETGSAYISKDVPPNKGVE